MVGGFRGIIWLWSFGFIIVSFVGLVWDLEFVLVCFWNILSYVFFRRFRWYCYFVKNLVLGIVL